MCGLRERDYRLGIFVVQGDICDTQEKKKKL